MKLKTAFKLPEAEAYLFRFVTTTSMILSPIRVLLETISKINVDYLDEVQQNIQNNFIRTVSAGEIFLGILF